MSKITKEVIKAIKDKKNFKKNNTQVLFNKSKNSCSVYLFNNLIAEVSDTHIFIRDSGWCTVTTKEILNGILSLNLSLLRLSIKKGQWFLNGELWDGKVISINI